MFFGRVTYPNGHMLEAYGEEWDIMCMWFATHPDGEGKMWQDMNRLNPDYDIEECSRKYSLEELKAKVAQSDKIQVHTFGIYDKNKFERERYPKDLPSDLVAQGWCQAHGYEDEYGVMFTPEGEDDPCIAKRCLVTAMKASFGNGSDGYWYAIGLFYDTYLDHGDTRDASRENACIVFNDASTTTQAEVIRKLRRLGL